MLQVLTTSTTMVFAKHIHAQSRQFDFAKKGTKETMHDRDLS